MKVELGIEPFENDKVYDFKAWLLAEHGVIYGYGLTPAHALSKLFSGLSEDQEFLVELVDYCMDGDDD